jgi:serine/threonine protein kinase/tetratricopeptide (TPR) repeat protein
MSASGPTSNEDASRPARALDQERSSTLSVGRGPEFAETIVPTADESRTGAPADTPLPAAFGRYRVTRLLGRGGMGSVYLGYDDQLDRAVAIKAPHPGLFQSQEGRENFLREARTLAKLDHPRVIPIYDAGETEDGQCYVVCKFVDSQTLKDHMRDARLTPREASNLMAQVADALHHAHKQGFVHRDIKPSNILIDREGSAWVADFGLAVAESAQRRLAGEVSGTPAYMTPEQTRGDVQYLDGRADIWSVGVILYELLTGRRPFAGATVEEVFAEISRKEPRPPRMIDESIPQPLEQIVLKCLRKPVADRYSTAHDLARDLRHWGRKRVRPTQVIVVVLASAMSIAALLAIPPLFNRRGTEELVTRVNDNDSVGADSMETSELALLIEELRGLRRDLGESNARIDALAGDREPDVELLPEPEPDTVRNQVEPLELLPAVVDPAPPAGIESEPPAAVAWEPVPLPEGFAEIEQQLQSAREAGDVVTENSLLLDATNGLIDGGYYAEAEYFAFRMVELAGNDPSDVPIAYGQLGLAEYRLGKFDEALAHYDRSLEVYQPLYDQLLTLPDTEQTIEFRSSLARLLGLTWMRIGNVHKAEDNYQAAKDAYETALEIFEAHDRQSELVTLLLNYGGLESQNGNYQDAVRLLQRGLATVEANGESESRAEFLINLGNAYSRSGDNSLALQNYHRARDSVSADSDYALRSGLLINWSAALLEEGEHEQARELLRELQQFARPDDADSQRLLQFLPALDRALEQ